MFPVYSDYDDLSQVVTVSTGGNVTELPLVHKWGYYSFDFRQEAGQELEIAFHVNKLMPAINRHPTDTRTLSVRVGPLMFHDDESRHERVRFTYENAVLNLREFLAGATTLTSFPLDLGIDLFGKCNIKPACVYCPWDGTKNSEGENTNVVVDERTLEEYGPFFHAARALVNCSFGEPLLHSRLAQILDFTARHEKVVELSTNGQAFTPATVTALAGKPVVLYVSLDAASAEVYGRLRNDRWHEVVTGLTFLREARRRANGLPKLNMVFMPMRANLRDLEAYFRLCRMVDADLLVLRPLNYGENADMTADRGGYHFVYARELLSLDELQAVGEQCEEYSARYDVLVGNQFDFGKIKQPGIKRKPQGANRDGQSEDR
jgi:MoaA/NifB/PqqE/SkfB family radical SAM enzyme